MEVLRSFAERRKITFPLLSDPDSRWTIKLTPLDRERAPDGVQRKPTR